MADVRSWLLMGDGTRLLANHFVWRPPRAGEVELGIEMRLYALDGAPSNKRGRWTVAVVRDKALSEQIRASTGRPVWWWNGDRDAPVLSPSVGTRAGAPVLSHGYLGGPNGDRPGVWVPVGDVPGEVEVVYVPQEPGNG